MLNISTMFKRKVPSQKKVYSKYIETNPNVSYKEFKRHYLDLIEIKKYFFDMNLYNFPDKKTIEHIFSYLSTNLNINKYYYIKNVVTILNEIQKEILEKTDSENKSEFSNSCSIILYKINLLKEDIALRINYNYKKLIKTVEFEKFIQNLLIPKDISKSIKIIFENIELMNYRDHNGRDFSDYLSDAIINARLNNKHVQYNYYRELSSFILNFNVLNINKEKILNSLKMNDLFLEYKNYLDEKIRHLPKDAKTGRYLLTNEYMISIDSDETKKIDDALSVIKTPYGSYILGIHITDVYSLGFLARDILLNTNENNIDRTKASLDELKKRNAISLFIEISSEGIIVNYKLIETKILVDRNLVHEDVARIIQSSSVSKELKECVLNLSCLYSIIPNSALPENPTIEQIAHVIVDKYMLLYGCIISEYFYKNRIPGIYLSDDNKYSLDKVHYDAGFNSYDTYSRSTSPIRDKSAFICQFLLHQFIFDNKNNFRKDMIYYSLKPTIEELNTKL